MQKKEQSSFAGDVGPHTEKKKKIFKEKTKFEISKPDFTTLHHHKCSRTTTATMAKMTAQLQLKFPSQNTSLMVSLLKRTALKKWMNRATRSMGFHPNLSHFLQNHQNRRRQNQNLLLLRIDLQLLLFVGKQTLRKGR